MVTSTVVPSASGSGWAGRNTPPSYTAVTPRADPVALGALPLTLVRPAIDRALRWFDQGDAFDRWTVARQTAALKEIVCARDDLPQVAAVDLSPFLPLLGLTL